MAEPLTGDFHSQQESRDGDIVQGVYSLVEADGEYICFHVLTELIAYTVNNTIIHLLKRSNSYFLVGTYVGFFFFFFDKQHRSIHSIEFIGINTIRYTHNEIISLIALRMK